MNQVGWCASLTIVVLGSLAAADPDDRYMHFDPETADDASFRPRICLNGLWDFAPLPDDADFRAVPDEPWQTIKVPSFWEKTAYFEFPPEWAAAHKAWFRRDFTVPAEWKDKRVFLHLGAVAYWCRVYVNGDALDTPETFAFLPITLDVTDHVHFGQTNVLAVAVQDATRYGRDVNAPESIHPLRGIWQDVYLFAVPQVHSKNLFVRTSVSTKRIDVDLCATNASDLAADVRVVHRVTDPDGAVVKEFDGGTARLEPHAAATLAAGDQWPDPKLWTPESPHLYTLHTVIQRDGRPVDEKRTRFGFREFRIERDRFILNGEKVTLLGCWDNPVDNIHPEQLTPQHARLQLQALKAMNANTIRWHGVKGIPIPLLYRLCDEMGFLVIAGLDSDSIAGDPTEQTLQRTETFFREAMLRDRNHPSIVIWNANNERFSYIYWEGTLRQPPADPQPRQWFDMFTQLDRCIKDSDPTRPVTFHGSYDLFGHSEIMNVHYPVYVVDLPTGRDFFRNLRRSWPAVFERDKPILVGEYWFVPCLQEFFEKYCGEAAFRDPKSALRAGADYNEQLSLGWRRDKIAGMLGFANYITFNMPLASHATRTATPRIEHESWEGPYVKPTYAMRPRVNPGWDPDAPPWSPTPVFDAFTRAFAPLAVWAPDAAKAYRSGQSIDKTIVVINDHPREIIARLRAAFLAGDRELAHAEIPVTIPKTDVATFTVKLAAPTVEANTDVIFRLALTEGKETIARRDQDVTLYPDSYFKPPVFDAPFQLYDRNGVTTAILKKAGVQFDECSDPAKLDSNRPLVVGYRSLDAAAQPLLTEFCRAGGHALVFEQDNQGSSDTQAYVQAPGHPIFDGIDGPELTGWQGDDNYVTDGAFAKPTSGNFLILADCDVKRTPLLRQFIGRGSLIRCQLRCSKRYGDDPTATRLIHNLLNAIASPPQRHPTNNVLLVKGSGATENILAHFGAKFGEYQPGDDIPADRVLVIGANAMQRPDFARCRDAIDRFVAQGGQVLVFPQPSFEPLFGHDLTISTMPLLEGRRAMVFMETDDQAVWGFNPLDFLGWTDWLCTTLVGQWSADWKPLVLLQERFTAFSFVSHYAPIWRDDADPQAVQAGQRMFQAEQDDHFARQHHKTIAAAVLQKSSGRGRYIVIQLPLDAEAARSPQVARLLASLLTDAGVALTDRQVETRAQIEDFHLVDLAPYANLGFKYTDETGGWSDQGPINDAEQFPVGTNFFAGIPFAVTDPNANDGRGCIGLKSQAVPPASRHYDLYPEKVEGIAVECKAQMLHILHATAWGDVGVNYARLIVHYADGQTESIDLVTGRNVADWWKPQEVPEARIGWTGGNESCSSIGAYVFNWENPRPDQPIQTIDFISLNERPIPLLIGISAARTHTSRWVALDEELPFGPYTIIPTRIEAFGTFTVQLSVYRHGRLIADGLGIRKGETRTVEHGGRILSIGLTGLDTGRAELAVKVGS